LTKATSFVQDTEMLEDNIGTSKLKKTA